MSEIMENIVRNDTLGPNPGRYASIRIGYLPLTRDQAAEMYGTFCLNAEAKENLVRILDAVLAGK